MAPKFGVLSQATKNKTYTPKNICSNASKDHSRGEYLALFYATRTKMGGGVEYNENNFKKKKTTMEKFKLKYRN